MEEEKSLLSVKEFAALLNVTPACIRRWLLERKIACVKVGNRLVRIPVAERDRIVQAGFRPARPSVTAAPRSVASGLRTKRT
jgi:excisionase family DNA binding protein